MTNLPRREVLIDFLTSCETPQTKRELVSHFEIMGVDRVPFKKLLREMETNGLIERQTGGGYSVPNALPAVTIVEICDIDVDGELLARPAQWNEELQGKPPQIIMTPDRKHVSAPTVGDRVLARLSRKNNKEYEAQPIRALDDPRGRVVGVVRQHKKGWTLVPADKKAKKDFAIAPNDLNNAKEGDLAIGEIQPSQSLRNKSVRIVNILGHQTDPRAISLLSAHEMGLRETFPDGVIAQTKEMVVPPLQKRDDLRDIPLVTIDGADARDFDDAVYATKTDDGFHLIVAIADVAHYVRPDSALDREAYKRGNSTYFPDRVIPMLPEALSNDLCSLRPDEDRACMAVHLYIDNQGGLKKYKFVRGLMRSSARLTYEQVQDAKNGIGDEMTKPLLETVITPLYEAFNILDKARQERGALELDLPERQILINEQGEMTGVKKRLRLDSHKLIEEFMILANVAAASALEAKRAPCVYRIHDRPSPEKVDSVREFLEGFGMPLAKGQVMRAKEINKLLMQAANEPFSHVISQVVLRAQAQAVYHRENIGHFGLALGKYAHFTSPIRRYADLLVHRSLIKAYDLGEGGLEKQEEVTLEEKAQHISETERTSIKAERSANDRFTSAYLSEQVGAEFNGTISGVSRFGLFVELADTGADGLIPIRTLPNDYYIHDGKQHALVGKRSGRLYRMGARVIVRLVEANALTGSTILELTDNKGAEVPGISMKRSHMKTEKSGKGGKKRFSKGKKNKGSHKQSGSNPNTKPGTKPKDQK